MHCRSDLLSYQMTLIKFITTAPRCKLFDVPCIIIHLQNDYYSATSIYMLRLLRGLQSY